MHLEWKGIACLKKRKPRLDSPHANASGGHTASIES